MKTAITGSEIIGYKTIIMISKFHCREEIQLILEQKKIIIIVMKRTLKINMKIRFLIIHNVDIQTMTLLKEIFPSTNWNLPRNDCDKSFPKNKNNFMMKLKKSST
jgi:hypothetical protein